MPVLVGLEQSIQGYISLFLPGPPRLFSEFQIGFSEEAYKSEETRVWGLPGDCVSSWNWPVLPSMARSPLHSPYLSSSKAGVPRVPHAGPYLWCH